MTDEHAKNGSSLLWKRLHPEASAPFRAYGSESVGWDLAACLISDTGRENTRVVPPHATVAIPTGLALRPPPDHAILVCSRSGLAKHSVFVANAPGVIDPGYTGEIQVLLFNGSMEPYYVKHGHRIAQALVAPIAVTTFLQEVEVLPETSRGGRGFGSSGQ